MTPPSMIGGRELARQVLRRVRRDAAYANVALDVALRRAPGLRREERALATELVYGVLRQQRRLDHVLAQCASAPLGRVEGDLLDVLRLGAYQLLFLDRVPTYAVVNEAVDTARALSGGRAAGFVNAVLRGVKPALLERALPEDALKRVAVMGSLPDALAEILHEKLGVNLLQEFAKACMERAPLTVRANPLKGTPADVAQRLALEGAEVHPGRWAPSALTVRGIADPFHAPSYRDGWWTAQDEAAQLVGWLVDPQPGERVLDACAGTGGKTTHLAEQMTRGGREQDGALGLVAADISARKLALLDEQARRLGLACATLCTDLTEAGPLRGQLFDRVLVDAPCSGLGVLRRHPELKWRWQRDRLGDLVALQRRLLGTAVSLLRPGGVLVYAVCTVTDEEGPQQLEWLCERFRGLRPDGTGWGGLQRDGVLRTWPHEHDVDGFFAARVVCQSA